ncbi:hypothetical protein CANCADRAFT_99623 [Tortispora caseinolytica NRRL Y-17796]|uniref:L-ornithine N(5)-monooxygenase [NAD(P)H] n=1 Tax=Tortispora caseinolytica NRRL Y-17796 TaxID=767744 RepID=A0A1E4TE95_9ASCO|nr:hypothetical protein CANCADRAFT_99623 [Tortispora caseinolytica NRRL Y-17796]
MNTQECLDLVGVGFGPAGLAIAIYLTETNPKSLRHVEFVEAQDTFCWHSGMLIPSAKMQISFLKDFATLRDPKSSFTFLNYLFENQKLVPFINLSTFLPYRVEYEDYMRWCASRVKPKINYGQKCNKVVPILENGSLTGFRVHSYSKEGESQDKAARNIALSVGGEPSFPKCLQNLRSSSRSILHSSEYMYSLEHIDDRLSGCGSVAVIGSGQSAAEIFMDLLKRFPNVKVDLIIRGYALRPSDDSPFVNEIFDPESTTVFYNQDQKTRDYLIESLRSTNYSVVRPHLIDEIYEHLYQQKLPGEANRGRVLNLSEVSGARLAGDDVTLSLKSIESSDEHRYNVVVCATGYDRVTAVRHLLRGCEAFYDLETLPVTRTYQLTPRKEANVAPGVGIWLLGCNESTHGLSDSLLSVLAITGKDVVEDIADHNM